MRTERRTRHSDPFRRKRAVALDESRYDMAAAAAADGGKSALHAAACLCCATPAGGCPDCHIDGAAWRRVGAE